MQTSCSYVTCLTLLVLGVANADAWQHTFSDPSSTSIFNHLAVDRNTGQVYVGATNRIYQLTSDLEVTQTSITGPANETILCLINCEANSLEKPMDNVNKVLLIDYATNQLLTCGSALQGLCQLRNLKDLSHDIRVSFEQVVANDATSSTAAFIAPGPPNPPYTTVMYVGVTFTGTSLYRADVPAVSSRSLESDRLFSILRTNQMTGTSIFVNSLSRERYYINYVYGFSSEGFSYFLTTQPKSVGSDTYYSKLVRVCHDDDNYQSYTEIPISCTGEGGTVDYNLVQAAFVGKPGSNLAREFGISTEKDVLFAAFSQSESTNPKTPSDRSALCVYSHKDIRHKFTQNIRKCYNGNGTRGLDFITPTRACIAIKGSWSSEDFCELDLNTPLGGEEPVEAVPVAVFTEKITAVTAIDTGAHTVVYAGTAQGHLKKIIVENATPPYEIGDVVVDEGSPVRKDLFFDNQLKNLYVMTERKVSKVKVDNVLWLKTDV